MCPASARKKRATQLSRNLAFCPKNLFLEKFNMGIKKRRILCRFQIRWCHMPLKKAWAKKLCEFWIFSFLCIFSWFFAFNFYLGTTAFFYTLLIFFKKKYFWVIIALLQTVNANAKKLYIFKHFAKSKKFFSFQYLSFSVWFLLKFQKSIKLKPPSA
jgi:hypothetical protein